MQVPCPGVRVEREADGPVGRVLLRRRAAGARHRAEARRPDAPRGGEPRRMGRVPTLLQLLELLYL
jgi:hypothetical protein